MNRHILVARVKSAIVVLGVGSVLVSPVVASDLIAEARNDAYFDSNGNFVALRNADLPEGYEPRPMSQRERFALMGVQLPERPVSLKPRALSPKPQTVDVFRGLTLDKVVVKFVDDVPARLRDGRLRGSASLGAVSAILARFPDAELHRLFESTDERILDEDRDTGEILGGEELADLNNYYMLIFQAPTRRAVDLANELLALDVVEEAYLQPRPRELSCSDLGAPTPLFAGNQNYLEAAPIGMDAYYAWGYHSGGNGYGPSFQVVDLEMDWCTSHEDLNFDATHVLNGLSGSSDPDHGTAVLGIYGACINTYGNTGISYDVGLKACDVDTETSVAAAVTKAASFMSAGEIMVTPIGFIGPNPGTPCDAACTVCPPDTLSQFGMVPIEFFSAEFNAIKTATANGIIIVESAANGSNDLDLPLYGNKFNRGFRDSRAILVGAAWPITHLPTCWTTFGSRVDVHAYGENVWTTGGGGDAFHGIGCSEDYTSSFGGTSSAGPMIAGACACIQGIAKAKYGFVLGSNAMRQLLQTGATPQGPPTTRHIGPMPNLHAVIDAMGPFDVDLIVVSTPAGWSYPLVPRATNDAGPAYAPLGAAALPCSPASTYFNIMERNTSTHYSTGRGPRVGVLIDGNVPVLEPELDVGPGTTMAHLNFPTTMMGGRHTLIGQVDSQGIEPETDETNNQWAHTFLWAGRPLSYDATNNSAASSRATCYGWGPWYNCDGFSGTTGANYWYAFAVLSSSPGADLDIEGFVNAPTNIPEVGFDVESAWSHEAGGAIDFVVIDRNFVPPGTYYAGVLNFGGQSQQSIEFDMDHGVVPNPGTVGPFTLAGSDLADLVELHEIYLQAGVPVQITVQPTSGMANVGLSVYNPNFGFSAKMETIPGGFANANGPGQGETLVVIPAVSDWHGIVVWKVGASDLAQSLTYNLVIGQFPNLTAGTPTNWYGPVVPRSTTDGASNDCPLSPELSGNSATTSFNFATYNSGGAPATAPWSTAVYADNQGLWYGTQNTTVPGSTFSVWNNTPQGGPQSIVRGGRHYIQSLADVFGQVPEVLEFDNFFTDWFVWTPLDLANQVPVLRSAPPPRHPLGWGPYESCDGFRVPGYQGSWWTAIGMIPTSMTDEYDMRLHTASGGSRDGFGAWLAESADPFAGNPDFCIVNYNTAPFSPTDVSVTNVSNSSDNFYIQRADAPYWGFITSIWDSGPLVLDTHDCLDIHEFYFASGVPTYITLRNLSGGVDLETFLFDGTIPYHTKGTYITYDNAHGPGGDEHLGPMTLSHSGYYALVVAKSKASDVNNASTYELVINVGPPVDAPVVESSPTAFALSAPRPNPSSAGVSVELAVPAGQGKASVVVYDLSGRRVRTLADGESTAGRHVLTWDGRDTSGKKAAAGVYFVRLETDKVRQSKKITLLR